MYSNIRSFTLFGLEAVLIDVEVTVTSGLPKFEIIGMPDTAIRESKERIFQSLKFFGYEIPPGNITVNLAPAEIRKHGSLLDLPIALGMLIASGQLTTLKGGDVLAAGELSLTGEVRPVSGIFNAAQACASLGISDLIFPWHNHSSVSFFKDLGRIAVRNLSDAVEWLKTGRNPYAPPADSSVPTSDIRENGLDYSQVYGNDLAKKAVQLSLTAGLNLLLIGPPGCGKTMLLKRMPTLFDRLSEEDAITVTGIHSAGGRQFSGLISRPPFREVHTAVSEYSLTGGGTVPHPGEVSLAHKGVLFLDELPEFSRRHIQSLRTPIESREVTVRRVNYSYTFPCDFILAAAANPCPCGYYGDDQRICTCSPGRVSAYFSRLSGPILDRIEMILYINPVKKTHLFRRGKKTSADLRAEMQKPRDFLRRHPDHLSDRRCMELPAALPFLKKIIKDAYARGYISLRRVKAIIKTALALSLFDGLELKEEHVFEAINLCRYKWEV